MTPHETRDLFDELIDIARTVVCVADEGPDSARELGLCGGSPLVAACRAAVHRINAEAATVNPRAELSILRDQTAADVQTIATLQDENARLKADIACMVEKAASKSLEGYRELGRQTVEALRQHDDARAELVTLKADAARREREALSHEDACVLSRIFNQYQLIQIDQYERINEFLKSLIESAFLTQRQEQSKP